MSAFPGPVAGDRIWLDLIFQSGQRFADIPLVARPFVHPLACGSSGIENSCFCARFSLNNSPSKGTGAAGWTVSF